MQRFSKVVSGVAAAAAATAGVGMLGTTEHVEAALIAGPTNIPIPANIDGVYLNIITGQTGAAGFAGYDINLYATSTAPGPSFFTSATANATTTNRGYLAVSATGAALNLIGGGTIDGTGLYNTAVTAGTNFTTGVQGIVGFRFFNEADSAVHFGYAVFTPPSTSAIGTPGLIISTFYESVAGAPAIVAIPEPSGLGLLAAGALGLIKRRSRSAA